MTQPSECGINVKRFDPELVGRRYDEVAEKYAEDTDINAFNASYERPAMLSLLPDVKGMSVLDAGCGSGFYTEWLVSHGAHLSKKRILSEKA